jgi:hypothetical protein
MTTNKNFLGKLLAAIGSLFTGLFNEAHRVWKKLSPEIQAAMLHGSAIVDVINKNIDAAPAFIIELLQKKFPDLTLEKLHSGLNEVAKGLNIAETVNNDELGTLIEKLQVYLNSLNDGVWAGISHTIASIFAVITVPAGTKFATISSLMEYVYHHFIKKDE